MADPKSQDQVLQQILASQEAMNDSIHSLQTGQEEMKGSIASLEKGQDEMKGSIASLEKNQKAMGMQLTDLQQQAQSLRNGQDRLDRRMDGMEAKMDAGFEDTHRLIAEIPRAVLDGVEPYVERKIKEHEQRFHAGAAVAA